MSSNPVAGRSGIRTFIISRNSDCVRCGVGDVCGSNDAFGIVNKYLRDTLRDNLIRYFPGFAGSG